MFRGRRRPKQVTPFFKIPPPYNPTDGAYAELHEDGIYPYCAMMQVAEEDTYDNYVVCRGIDIRTKKFSRIISVAKPYGRRKPGTYKVGEIYPAFLPTQSVESFVPPIPSDVPWRVGQTSGVAEDAEARGGHPEDLNDSVEILYDHNNKVVQWLLIESGGGVSAELAATKQAEDFKFLIYPDKKTVGEGVEMWCYDAFIMPTDADPYQVLRYRDGWAQPEGAEDVWLVLVQNGQYLDTQVTWPRRTQPPTSGHPAMHLTPHTVQRTGVSVEDKEIVWAVRPPLYARAMNNLPWYPGDIPEQPIYPYRILSHWDHTSQTLTGHTFGDGPDVEPIVSAYPARILDSDAPPLGEVIHLHHEHIYNQQTIPIGYHTDVAHQTTYSAGTIPPKTFLAQYDGDRWRPAHIPLEDVWDAILCSDLFCGWPNKAGAKLVIYPYGCEGTGLPAQYNVTGGNYSVECVCWWIHNGDTLPSGTRVGLMYDPHIHYWVVKWAQCPASDPDLTARMCDRCVGSEETRVVESMNRRID